MNGSNREAPSGIANIALSGLQAAIPAAVVAALISGRRNASEPVDIDARELRLSIPPDAVVAMLRAAQPDLDLSIEFEDGAILATMAGLPPVRVTVPAEGLRLTIDHDGARLSG